MSRRKRTVLETEWFSIEEEYYDDIPSLDGKPYYRLNAPDGAMVLAFTDADEIILIKQFRPALDRYTLELPSGMVGPSEKPKDAAARELREETGYVCGALECLGETGIMMHRCSSRHFGFYGTGAKLDPDFTKEANIEVIPTGFSEFKDLVRSGEFHQLAALGLLVQADWKLGTRLVTPYGSGAVMRTSNIDEQSARRWQRGFR